MNLKAAKALGITIPESSLLRADQVIEQAAYFVSPETPASRNDASRKPMIL